MEEQRHLRAGHLSGAGIFPGSASSVPQNLTLLDDEVFFTAFAGSNEFDFSEPHFILGTRVTHDAEVKDKPALKLTLERK